MRASRSIALLGRKAPALLAILALLFVALPSFPAQDPSSKSPQDAQKGPKLSKELEDKIRDTLRGGGPSDLVPVIVRTVDEPSASHLGRLRDGGGGVKARHSTIHGYSARVPASQVGALADDPEVEHVSFDSPVTAHLDIAYPAVKADQAYANSGGLGGQGIGIAIVDSGVYMHQDLRRPSLSPQVLEVAIIKPQSGPVDYYGHGTHVAGIINGNGAASSDPLSFRRFKGIAPGARILSIRALAADGTGYTSDIISGIDWAVNNRSTYNIRVLNLSLGHPVYESYKDDPLCRAVERAVEQGIVVVAAAGNDGRIGSGFGTITSPGNDPKVITVGAMDDGNTVTSTDDILAWYSSKGPSLIDYVVKPDIVAPGTSIVSLRVPSSYLDTNYHQLALKNQDYRTDPLTGGSDGAYFSLSGTSMATPFVSGTVALMLQKEPRLNPATVKARLMRSAVKDNQLVFETGAGYLDVDAALKETGYADSALSPAAMLAPDKQIYFQDTRQIWGVTWGETAIWGGGKGSAAGLSLTDVPAAILSAYTAIWGGKGGALSIIENNQVTGSGAIWTGACSSVAASSGTVDSTTAIWGGGR